MSQQQLSATDVAGLFSVAGVSAGVQDLLVENLNASAMALAACQGPDPVDLGASEVALVTFVTDESGSMIKVADEVRASLLESAAAMNDSKSSSALTLSLVNFSDRVEIPFANKPVESVEEKDIVYNPGGTTALFDAVMDGLTGALAFEEQVLRTGVTPTVIFCVFSDGADNASVRATAAKIRQVIEKEIVLRRENWTIAFVGFETFETKLNGVDFTAVARSMGIESVITIDLKGDEYARRHKIRQTFRLVSKSVIRRSKTTVDVNAPTDFFAV